MSKRQASQAAAASAQSVLLHEARSKIVAAYRRSQAPWPDGLGAWYRAEDWADDGTLVAVGETRARALDPWANDRKKGLPCPPLPRVNKLEAVNTSVAVTPVNTPRAPKVIESVAGDPKAARRLTQKLAMRDLRQRRADERERAEREKGDG
jgi:hypothetical protein